MAIFLECGRTRMVELKYLGGLSPISHTIDFPNDVSVRDVKWGVVTLS